MSLDEVFQHAPYDIIILSHILEHTAFPSDVVNQCAQYLGDQGLLMIVVPYEQAMWLFQKDTSPAAHQSAFSATSVCRLLSRCGFRSLDVEVAYLSYRVFPMWNILVSAVRTEGMEAGGAGHRRRGTRDVCRAVTRHRLAAARHRPAIEAGGDRANEWAHRRPRSRGEPR